MRAEIVNTIEDNFYKPVDKSKLDDASLKGIVGVARRPLLALPHAQGGEGRSSESVSGQFEGVGMSVEKDERGLRVLNVFDGSPAEQRRHPQQDLIRR